MQLEAIATGGLSLALPGMPPAFSREANPSPLLLFRPPQPRGVPARSSVPLPNPTSPRTAEWLALSHRPPTMLAVLAAMPKRSAETARIGKTDRPAAATAAGPIQQHRRPHSAQIMRQLHRLQPPLDKGR